MSANVVVHKPASGGKFALFEEIGNRVEDVRRRAFELFQRRSAESGDPLDDWLRAEREVMGWAATELIETDTAYQAEVALPGFDARDVHVIVTPAEIIVRAFRQDANQGAEKSVLWSEFNSRDLYRSLAPPEPALKPIDPEKTTATIEHGLLRIVAPKAVAKPEAPGNAEAEVKSAAAAAAIAR